jgi:hypothetical protein
MRNFDPVHFRFGSLADICAAKSDVRFTPGSGHVRCNLACPLWARSGRGRIGLFATILATVPGALPKSRHRWPSRSRNNRLRTSVCPYRPEILSSTYSSTFCRAADGSFGEESMRLMICAKGPTLVSRFSTAQAVGRNSPRAAACFAVVSHPAATKAARISASFDACLAFAFDNWRSTV